MKTQPRLLSVIARTEKKVCVPVLDVSFLAFK